MARIDSRVNFLNANNLRNRVVDWLDARPAGTPLIVDASGINGIDYTGVMMFIDAYDDLQALGHELILCEVKSLCVSV